jgi:6-phosphofructokinase 1
VISGILRAEGKGHFDSRTAVLGHLQQGGIPSPLDRIRATRLAVNCIDWIEKSFLEAKEHNLTSPSPGRPLTYTSKKEHSCVIGIRGANIVFSSTEELLKETDMAKRMGKKAWWMGLTRLVKVLSKYYYTEEDAQE